LSMEGIDLHIQCYIQSYLECMNDKSTAINVIFVLSKQWLKWHHLQAVA